MSQLEKLLVVTNDLKSSVLKCYGKTEKDVQRDLKIMYDWWNKQEHLPIIKDDEILERLIMRNKYRIEQTKKKLDAYFTLKGLYSEFFLSSWDDIENCLATFRKSCYVFPLKTTTTNNERLTYFKLRDTENLELFDCLSLFRTYILLFEILCKYDYSDATRLICDLENFKFSFVKKLDPVILYKGMRMAQEGFAYRISGIHYINAPSYTDVIIKILSPLLKQGRINVHGSIDELKEMIPEELLPKEYGGEAGTIDELQDAWTKEFVFHKDFLMERMQHKSDETKRKAKSQYDDLFGTDGTFKKLNLD